jgi:hypothetical protein
VKGTLNSYLKSVFKAKSLKAISANVNGLHHSVYVTGRHSGMIRSDFLHQNKKLTHLFQQNHLPLKALMERLFTHPYGFI